VAWTLGAALPVGLWDLLGQDLAMARGFGSATGFPYSNHWLFASVLHEGARRVAWALHLGLVLAGGLYLLLEHRPVRRWFGSGPRP
jgi:hypothetical protein